MGEDDDYIAQSVAFGELVDYGVDEPETEVADREFIEHRLEKPRFVVLIDDAYFLWRFFVKGAQDVVLANSRVGFDGLRSESGPPPALNMGTRSAGLTGREMR